VLALASLAVVLDDARDHGDLWFGIVVWSIFVVIIVLAAALLVAIVSLGRRRRPSKPVLLGALLVALVVLFPLPGRWDTVEGEDTAHGLLPTFAFVPLALQEEHDPLFIYSETCCG
jgi:hypothetical protein